jgi:hypothetical protein
MTRSRTLAITGLAAGLLAGGGVGLTLGLPSVAGAETAVTAPAHRKGDAPPAGVAGGHGPRASLAIVASLLGSSPAEVMAGLRAGNSIAAQAEAAGVPLSTVVDALVADATERINAMVQRSGPDAGLGHQAPMGPRRGGMSRGGHS